MIPLTYAVTLADWTPEQDMLRMMLLSLEQQTCKEFDVILADHHYDARKDVVKELSQNHGFEIKHTPIYPAPHVAKNYIDCSVFNVGWVMSEAERCVRYSEWRFLHPTLTETILNEPADSFLDFDFHNLDEKLGFWDRDSGSIDWDKVTPSSNPLVEFDEVPLNCYANNTISRQKWVEVNGFNEVNYNFFHWEDIDYSARCRHAGYAGKRIPNKMYRIDHPYGGEANRANRPCERPFKQVCASCEDLFKYVRFHILPTHKQWGDFWKAKGAKVVTKKGTEKEWLVCEKCNFVLPYVDTEDIAEYVTREPQYTRSPINVSGSGRNLEPLAKDMKGLSWSSKIDLYKQSYTNKKYL